MVSCSSCVQECCRGVAAGQSCARLVLNARRLWHAATQFYDGQCLAMCAHAESPLHTIATLCLQEEDDAYSKNELLLDYPAMAVLS